MTGTFFQPLAIAYGLAVLASMVVALTVTPALRLMLVANAPIQHHASPLESWLQPRYQTLLARTIQRPRLALVSLAGVVLIGLAVLPFLGQSLLPDFKERNLQIHLNSAPGTSQPEMSRISGRVSSELRSLPGVRNVGAHVGRAVFGDQVVNVNSAELWVSIDPSADYDKTVAAIQEVVNGYPGLHHDVLTYLKEKSSEVTARPNDAIVVRVYGDSDALLRSAAEGVKTAIAGINSIVDSHLDLPVQQPILEIEVNLAAALRYGITPGDARRAAATMFSGLQVGSLFEEQKVFDVVVWSTPETRNSVTSVGDLLIDTPSGGYVRLGDVAQVRIVSASSVIRHESVHRYLDVIADVQGRDLGSVAADVKGRLQQVQFPLEYHAEVLGEYAERQAALTRLFVFAVAAVLGIFLLLQAAFMSWRLAFLVILTLPSALVGGVLAAFVAGGILSLGSLAGFLMLFGIAARNGIMLINHFQHLERYEGEAFGSGLVLRGARERLGPILMTALATALALLPALLLGDIPGLEIVRPLAVVILGGMLTSTLLNLFIVPALYLGLRVRK